VTCWSRNFAPGCARSDGAIVGECATSSNPAHDFMLRSKRPSAPGPYEECKVLRKRPRNVAGGAAVHPRGFPRRAARSSPGAQIGDSGTGLPSCFRHCKLAAPISGKSHRARGPARVVRHARTGGAQSRAPLKAGVTQQRLKHGPLTGIQPIWRGPCRSGKGGVARAPATISGGGPTGPLDSQNAKAWETDPDAYIYFITQGAGSGRKICEHDR